jgi:hypothetical protein
VIFQLSRPNPVAMSMHRALRSEEVRIEFRGAALGVYNFQQRT